MKTVIANREDLRQFIFATDDNPNVKAGKRADAVLARADCPKFGTDWAEYLAKLGYTAKNNWSK